MTTLDHLLTMDHAALARALAAGGPLEPDALADTQYRGTSLMHPLLRRLLWTTFRKTFHRDPARGVLRGWNVRMEQTGLHGPAVPKRGRDGRPRTFGHYHVVVEARRFPGGVTAPSYLDYTRAGNHPLDPGRVGFTPLVAVNPGDMDLLLGWEVIRVGPALLPLPVYFALAREGPLEEVVPVPRG